MYDLHNSQHQDNDTTQYLAKTSEGVWYKIVNRAPYRAIPISETEASTLKAEMKQIDNEEGIAEAYFPKNWIK